MPVKMSREELQSFLVTEFPQADGKFIVQNVAPNHVTVLMPVSDKHLRPGGTVSGATIFALADVSFYLAVLAMIGPRALAVTTNCSIDFLRKPAAGVDLVAQVRLLKLGRVLAVGDVLIHSQGLADPVARAALTYSIPAASH
ncbi:MAG: PaaI family thioesterase [Paracoccaceae bacterium]